MIFNTAPSAPPEFRTQRLLMRPMKLTDANDLFEYARDPSVTEFVTWTTHHTLDDSYRFLSYVVRQYELGTIANWGIVELASNKFIGTIGCHGIDDKNYRTEAGYALSRAYWGRGLMTEALRAWIDVMFLETDLNRIEAVHNIANEASGRVMQRAGMQFEGLFRQRQFVKEKFVSVKQYAILKEDWDASARRS